MQDMKFGWEIVVGTFVGFCGAAFGSVGGVGGGGIFVPMLSLIIGFDPKSATAISKCKLMRSLVFYFYGLLFDYTLILFLFLTIQSQLLIILKQKKN